MGTGVDRAPWRAPRWSADWRRVVAGRLRWWWRACRGLASVLGPALLLGMAGLLVAPTPYVVTLDLVATDEGAPPARLPSLLERELDGLAAAGTAVAAAASPGSVATPGDCIASAVTARFTLPRGKASALFSRLPTIAAESGARLCGWGYRTEVDVYDLLGSAAGLGLPLVAIALVVLSFRDRRRLRMRLNGVHRRAAPALWLGAVAGVVCLLVQLSLASALAGLGIRTDPGSAFRPDGMASLLWLVLTAVVCAPLVEEVAFRAIFLDRARRAVGPFLALVVSALAFTAFHTPATTGSLFVMSTVGVLLGLLWLHTRSLLACWTAHAGHNAMVLGLVFGGFA